MSILEERTDEKNLPYIKDVKKDIGEISKLVSELLTYSKAHIKTPSAELEKVNLHSLIERVINREKAERQAEIEIKVDESLEVLAQPELLSRAFANVIRYASDAESITISAEKLNKQVKISITDKGKGVHEFSLEKLFDPFYRFETNRGQQTGGSGLGLAIVKTCIEACGGKVSAENLPPKGFAINISLKSASN